MAWLGEMVYGLSQTPQVWLDHQVWEEQGALAFNWDAIAALFPPGLLDAMFESYTSLLQHLADQPARGDDLFADPDALLPLLVLLLLGLLRADEEEVHDREVQQHRHGEAVRAEDLLQRVEVLVCAAVGDGG